MSLSSFNSRLFIEETYSNEPIAMENQLERALLLQPDTISGVVTHLAGREDMKFPLTFLTQGKGRTMGIPVKTIDYNWPIIGRVVKSDMIVSHTYSPSDKVGLNHQPFYVVMKTQRLIDQHYATTKNGTKLRIMGRGDRVAGGFRYKMQLMEGTAASYVSSAELSKGSRISMVGGAPVAASLSKGNYSNRQMPGKLRNQISILRKSYELAGNIANKRINIELEVPGQGKTNLYMNYEKWLHMTNWMQDCEEHIWYSKYNRLADGTIPQTDEATGLPIPVGAGVLDQIPNTDTYGKLGIKKLRTIVTDVLYGATDAGKRNIVLFTGEGGMQEFDRAVKEEAGSFELVASSGGVGQKFVTGQDGSWELEYGAYFNTYRHINGHTITVKRNNIFDMGGQAEASELHPETGLPLESYRMVFLDMSVYDGQDNVVMVHEEGRSMRTGVLKGMSETPIDFQGNDVTINLATDEDKSSVHFLKTTGIAIRRPSHCFMLEMDLS